MIKKLQRGGGCTGAAAGRTRRRRGSFASSDLTRRGTCWQRRQVGEPIALSGRESHLSDVGGVAEAEWRLRVATADRRRLARQTDSSD